MALRTTTLAADKRPLVRSAESWRTRVESAIATAAAAIRARDHERLAAVYADLLEWEDVQRAYQARRQVTECVLAVPRESALESWATLFATAAEALLESLERDVREPIILNYAGVLLYELSDLPAAEALFRAAVKLDPELPHVRRNLKAVKARKRGRQTHPFRGAFVATVRALGARARRVAALARPQDGLTLSFCMIVKDEEELLPGCLEQVAPWVDEMVIVDTGSTDRTVEIAESFGAKVVHFPWNGSFADARNVSLEHVTGDWVLYLDADEHLVPGDAQKLRGLLGRTWREAFYLAETNYTGGEESGSAVSHLSIRMWRHRPEYRFEGRIHEQKTKNMPRFLPERFEVTPIKIRHYGYLKSRIMAKDKAKRNLELLEAEAREQPTAFNSFNQGSEHLALGDAAVARRHLDDAWKRVRSEDPEDWKEIPFVSALAPRMVMARRQAGALDAARSAAAEALQAFPRHTDVVFESALIEKAAGDYARATELAERCLEMGDAPDEYSPTVGTGSYLALCLLGEVRTLEGDRDAATELYRRSLAEYPDYVAPVLPLAIAELAAGADPDELAALAGDKASALSLLATAYYEAGHAVHAESAFRRVLERQPANGAARVGLVEALLSQKRWDDAVAEAVLEPLDSPLGSIAAVEALFASAAAGDADGLAEGLRRATEAGTPVHELELYRAWHAGIAGGQLPGMVSGPAGESAIVALEALLRVEEYESFATVLALVDRSGLPLRERRERLARMYFRRGYLDSAFDEWAAVAGSAPDADAFIGLAQVAFAQDSHEDALDFAEAALEADPSSADAQRLVDAVRARGAGVPERGIAA